MKYTWCMFYDGHSKTFISEWFPCELKDFDWLIDYYPFYNKFKYKYLCVKTEFDSEDFYNNYLLNKKLERRRRYYSVKKKTA